MSVPRYCCEVEPENMPDMVIKKTAYWIEQHHPYCSVCGKNAPAFLVNEFWTVFKTPFCPHCGAEMENPGQNY